MTFKSTFLFRMNFTGLAVAQDDEHFAQVVLVCQMPIHFLFLFWNETLAHTIRNRISLVASRLSLTALSFSDSFACLFIFSGQILPFLLHAFFCANSLTSFFDEIKFAIDCFCERIMIRKFVIFEQGFESKT